MKYSTLATDPAPEALTNIESVTVAGLVNPVKTNELDVVVEIVVGVDGRRGNPLRD